MTDPNPLREDEVEAVAKAMRERANASEANDPMLLEEIGGWMDDEGFDALARAAILRLDQVREVRGK